MDHIPINLQMSGSFDGNTRLKERAPPNSMETYPWTSKTVYRALPGTAGFFVFVDALGAKVAAVFWTACCSATYHNYNQVCISNNNCVAQAGGS